MAERGEENEKYDFTDNLNDITNLFEEMVKQDELHTTNQVIDWKITILNIWMYK